MPSGQQIDGPQNGPAPQPWDILVQPNKMFMPQEAHIEVPHTATVKVMTKLRRSRKLVRPPWFGKGMGLLLLLGFYRVEIFIVFFYF